MVGKEPIYCYLVLFGIKGVWVELILLFIGSEGVFVKFSLPIYCYGVLGKLIFKGIEFYDYNYY